MSECLNVRHSAKFSLDNMLLFCYSMPVFGLPPSVRLPASPHFPAQMEISAKSFSCRTSENCARKSNHCRTSKNIRLKVLCLPHIRKKSGCHPPFLAFLDALPRSPFPSRAPVLSTSLALAPLQWKHSTNRGFA